MLAQEGQTGIIILQWMGHVDGSMHLSIAKRQSFIGVGRFLPDLY
jgi:hypothetical protein